MENTDKYTNRAALVIAIAGALLYILLIWNDNLWMDEAFSAVLVRTDFSRMLENSANDTLPPLYNILNWCFTRLLGFSAPVLRLSSILPMIGILTLSATLIRKNFGAITSMIFSLCIIGMPQMLYYGTEIRMYALGLFFVTACFVIVLCNEKSSQTDNSRILSRWDIFFILSALGAGYTHHFAFVAVGFIYLYLIVKAIAARDVTLLKRRCLITAVTIILYIPCLITTLAQMRRVTGYFSMPDVDLHFVISCIKQPFITQITPLSALLLICYAALTGRAIYGLITTTVLHKNTSTLTTDDPRLSDSGITGQNPTVQGSFEYTAMLLGPLLFLCVLCFGCMATIVLKSNIFSERYLFPTYGALWLCFSIAASKLKKRPALFGLTALLLIITVCGCISQLNTLYDPGVEEMKAYFNDNVSPGDSYIIHEKNYEIEICFRYYFPELTKTKWEEADASDDHNLWYIQPIDISKPAETDTDSGQDSSETLPEISEHGFDSSYCGDFSFDRYKFRLYKLTGVLQ